MSAHNISSAVRDSTVGTGAIRISSVYWEGGELMVKAPIRRGYLLLEGWLRVQNLISRQDTGVADSDHKFPRLDPTDLCQSAASGI